MVPHDELASTKHCLADPGQEYLLYLPDGGDTVVDLMQEPARLGSSGCIPLTARSPPLLASWEERNDP